jgi:hypothetical protein
MHTAFVCCSVLEKLPVKIESMASWGSDLLLIGSSDGHLLVYEVVRRPGGSLEEFDVRVLDSHKVSAPFFHGVVASSRSHLRGSDARE